MATLVVVVGEVVVAVVAVVVAVVVRVLAVVVVMVVAMVVVVGGLGGGSSMQGFKHQTWVSGAFWGGWGALPEEPPRHSRLPSPNKTCIFIYNEKTMIIRYMCIYHMIIMISKQEP